jgi:hypothetical protein
VFGGVLFLLLFLNKKKSKILKKKKYRYYRIKIVNGMRNLITQLNIAYQPAMLGGKGVYAARSLLRLRIEDGASSLRTYSNTNKQEGSSYLTFAYPNPTHEFFYIKTNNAELFDLKIKDVNGKVLLEKYNCTINTLFNCSTLSSGLYLLELQFSDGISEMLKIAIVH